MTMKTPDHANPSKSSQMSSSLGSKPRVLGSGKGLFTLPAGISGLHEKTIDDMFNTGELAPNGEDVASGKLVSLALQALSAHADGKSKPL